MFTDSIFFKYSAAVVVAAILMLPAGCTMRKNEMIYQALHNGASALAANCAYAHQDEIGKSICADVTK